jgi:integrase
LKYLTLNSYGIYKVRICLPVLLQTYFKRKEINKSLETKSRYIAKVRSQKMILDYFRLLTTIKMGLLSQNQLKGLVHNYTKEHLELSYSLPEHSNSQSTELASELLSVVDIQLEKSSQEYEKFVQLLEESQQHMQKQAHTPTLKAQSSKSNTKTNGEVLKLFLRKYKLETTSEQYRDVSNFMNDVLIHIIYEDGFIADTTLDDLLEVREVLSRFPKRVLKKYKVMSVEEILHAQIPQKDIISNTSLNKYMKWTKMFYKFADENSFIEKNPVLSIKLTSTSRASDERDALSKDEISILLHETKNNDVLHNLIIVLATSGMRLSEVYKCTVKKIDGVLCYDLSCKSLKLKTRSSYRVIPVHKRVNVDRIKILPSKSTVSRQVNVLIDKYITTDPKKVLYSLRHSFADLLRETGVESSVISTLMGHTHSNITNDRYGNGYSVKKLKDAIDTLKLDMKEC